MKRLVAVIMVAACLAGCTGTAGPDRRENSPSNTPAPHASNTPTSPASDAPTVYAPGPLVPVERTCQTPSQILIDWAALAVASYPGPIIATTLVYATTTDTGDWYVIGIDRLHSTDQGDSNHEFSFGLTNALGTGEGGTMINIGYVTIGNDGSITDVLSWNDANWTGETLEEGRQAVDTAIGCLQAIS